MCCFLITLLTCAFKWPGPDFKLLFSSPVHRILLVMQWEEIIHLQVIRHQDLAGLLDHWLWLELLFTEGVPPGVKVMLARAAGHSHVRSVSVKHSSAVWPAAVGRQQRWTGGRVGGTGGLTRLVHTRLTPWNYKEDICVLHACDWTMFKQILILLSNIKGADDNRPVWQ